VSRRSQRRRRTEFQNAVIPAQAGISWFQLWRGDTALRRYDGGSKYRTSPKGVNSLW
jgi:hypothetical protein